MQAGQSADLLLAQLIDIGYSYEAASAAISATRSAGGLSLADTNDYRYTSAFARLTVPLLACRPTAGGPVAAGASKCW